MEPLSKITRRKIALHQKLKWLLTFLFFVPFLSFSYLHIHKETEGQTPTPLSTKEKAKGRRMADMSTHVLAGGLTVTNVTVDRTCDSLVLFDISGGAANEDVILQLEDITAISGTDYTATMEVWDGANWVTYSSYTTLDANGEKRVRVPITRSSTTVTPVDFKLLVTPLNTGVAGTEIYDVNYSTINISGLTRISGTSKAVNSVYKKTNAITINGQIIDVEMTIKGISNVTTSSFTIDEDASNSARFQPEINSTSSSGSYVDFEFKFYKTGTSTLVSLENFFITAVDVDGGSTSQEFAELKDFASYAVGTGSGLVVTQNFRDTFTRFRGITSSLDGITFENTASFVTNYSNPVSSINLRLGNTGSSSSTRLFSVAMGPSVGTFSGSSSTSDSRTAAGTATIIETKAGAISGTTSTTINGTTTLSVSGNSVAGTWNSLNTNIATVDPTTGVVSGVAAGTATITYTVTGTSGCTDLVSVNVSVISAGTLAGTQEVCLPGTSQFTTNGTAGGNWTSSNENIATVNITTGLVSAVAPGTATITYTVGSSTATRTVTVTAAPNAGSLLGTQAICVSTTSQFSSNGDNGGEWISSNDNIATVNATTGLVSAVAVGTATITYTVAGTGGCSNDSETRTITVTAAPIAGTISGTTSTTISGTTTLSISGNSTAGTWSSSNDNIATVNPTTGVVTGANIGSVTITYTVAGSGGCADATTTTTVTVTAAPSAGTLAGTQEICLLGTSQFTTNGTAGGNWTSSNENVATVNITTGLVSAVAPGTATITYTVGSSTATRTVTVTAPPNAGSLSGTQAICFGTTSQFSSNGDNGGEWISSNDNIATVNATTGLVSAVAVGTATITYTVAGTGGCSNDSETRTITVTAAPIAGTISGTTSTTISGTTTLSISGNSTAGTWSSSNDNIATVNPTTGVVTGANIGSVTITYTVAGSGGCADATTTTTVTVTAAPSAGTLAGTQEICLLGTSQFTTNGTAGGNWTSSNENVATVNITTGLVSAVAPGTATITYTVG
ncbi:MAG: beta strand repeat-containing protein, partial [Spirosomataceae bacterium]